MNAKRAVERRQSAGRTRPSRFVDRSTGPAGACAPRHRRRAEGPQVKRIALDDPSIIVIIDESRSATRLASDHRDPLCHPGEAPAEAAAALPVLVEAIDAVDLWKKDRPIFRQALVLDEVFW